MKKLSIAIPASVVSDTPHLREKTSKVGLIGRAAAIFRVEEIIVFSDDPRTSQAGDLNLVARLLSYMETPQYLRKRLFKLSPDLQFVGILPPLRTPNHPLCRRSKDLDRGEFREGVVLSGTRDGSLLDIGVEQPALVSGLHLTVGDRVTVRVCDVGKPVHVEVVDKTDIPSYWGYSVTMERRSFASMLEKHPFELTVATSKYGSPFTMVSGSLAKRYTSSSSVLVAFGSPTVGLNEIVRRNGLELDEMVDFVVNTIPSQGTETVRTEEAVVASLAILNILLGKRAEAP